MKKVFFDHVKKMLSVAKETFDSNPLMGEETGAVNVKGDKTIGMDTKMEQVLVNYIKQQNISANIFSEEIGMINFHPNPTHTVVFDPLDGSTNYRLGKNLLPFGVLVAIYEGLTPKLQNIVASGAMENTSGLGWVYDGKHTYDLTGNPTTFKGVWRVTASTPVYFDLYYKQNYDIFAPLAQKVHIRWSGSNIGSLLYVMNESATCMGASCMRPEEIGAMVSLVKGAGGVAVDLKGNDLSEATFSTVKTYPILAGRETVVKFILNNLVK